MKLLGVGLLVGGVTLIVLNWRGLRSDARLISRWLLGSKVSAGYPKKAVQETAKSSICQHPSTTTHGGSEGAKIGAIVVPNGTGPFYENTRPVSQKKLNRAFLHYNATAEPLSSEAQERVRREILNRCHPPQGENPDLQLLRGKR